MPALELREPAHIRIEYADDGVVVGAPTFNAWEVGVTLGDGVERLLLFLAEDFEHYLECEDAELTKGAIDLKNKYRQMLKLNR